MVRAKIKVHVYDITNHDDVYVAGATRELCEGSDSGLPQSVE